MDLRRDRARQISGASFKLNLIILVSTYFRIFCYYPQCCPGDMLTNFGLFFSANVSGRPWSRGSEVDSAWVEVNARASVAVIAIGRLASNVQKNLLTKLCELKFVSPLKMRTKIILFK